MPDGSAGAAENMPAGFCDVGAGWALVVCGAFDSMRVLASGQMTVGEFHCEDLGAVLESVKCLCRDIPVDGLECALGPVVLFHWLLARSWAARCLSQLFGEASAGDSFTIDCEAGGFGGGNEGDDFGGC